MNIPLRDHAKRCAKRCAFGEKMSVSFHLRAVPMTTEKVTSSDTRTPQLKRSPTSNWLEVFQGMPTGEKGSVAVTSTLTVIEDSRRQGQPRQGPMGFRELQRLHVPEAERIAWSGALQNAKK